MEYEKKILWKSMAAINCLVIYILQNILFCLTEEKNSYRFGTTWDWEWTNDDKM